MSFKIHIGMRKIKSLLSVTTAFLIWQIVRVFLPLLEAHPVFAYIYAIVEMRESAEKTKNFGKLRIIATLVGLIVGLVFVAISLFLTSKVSGEMLKTTVEFLLVLVATLCSLCVAEMVNCKNFCGIAAIITVICMISHNEENIYLYAIMRVVQTLIGIISAMIINVFIKKRETEKVDESGKN